MESLISDIKKSSKIDLKNEILRLDHLIECRIDTPLFYENQIPIVVYYLYSGTIELGQDKKILYQASPGEVIGLNEFKNHIPSQFWATAKKGSKIYYLDKSSFKEIDQNLFNLLS